MKTLPLIVAIFALSLVATPALAGDYSKDKGHDHSKHEGHDHSKHEGHDHSKHEGHGGSMHFGNWDTNGDDNVDMDEFLTGMAGVNHPKDKEAAFKNIDTDGSGGISHDEWHAFKESHSDAMKDHGKMKDKHEKYSKESCGATQS